MYLNLYYAVNLAKILNETTELSGVPTEQLCENSTKLRKFFVPSITSSSWEPHLTHAK